MSLRGNGGGKRRATGLITGAAVTAMVGSMLVTPPASATVVVETIDPVIELARSAALQVTNAIYGFPGSGTVKWLAATAIKNLPQFASGSKNMEVPYGVYNISYVLSGANGGNGSSTLTGATIGGAFGITTGAIGLSGNGPLIVKPGETLWVNIGSPGGNSYGAPFGGFGGYNGGGDGGASGPLWATGGGGGGGMTSISQGGVIGSIPGLGSTNHVVVAGGGGGGAGDSGNSGLPPFTPKGGLGGAGIGLPGLIPGAGGMGAAFLVGGAPGINPLSSSVATDYALPGRAQPIGGLGGKGGTAQIGLPMPPTFLPIDGGGGGGGGAGMAGGGGGAAGTASWSPAGLTGLPFSGGGGGGSSGCLHTMPCVIAPGTPPLAGPGPLSLVRAPGTATMLWASVNSLGVREQATQRKYMVGGTYANQTSTIPTSYVSRLEDNGDIDHDWNTNPSSGDFENVNVIRQTSDGKTLIGGSFNVTKGGYTYSGIARLLPNGNIDTTFRPRVETRDSTTHTASSTPLKLAGGSVGLLSQPWQVYDIQPLANGKYAVAGSFGGPNGGKGGDPLLMLNSDGKVDSTFTPPEFESRSHFPNLLPGRAGSNDNRMQLPRIYKLALDTGGKLMAGGDFKVSNSGSDYVNLLRLNPDGTKDTTFSPIDWSSIDSLSSGSIHAITATTGGKFLIGGELPSVYRINPDGTMDNSFDHVSLSPNTVLQVPQTTVNVIAPVANGSKYVIGGNFLSLGGQSGMDYLGRISQNGSADNSFNALDLNGPVNDAAELVGGDVLVGGGFTMSGTTLTNYLLRTNPDGSLDSSFSLPDITP